jgi:2-keto-myo-inositol isomerase
MSTREAQPFAYCLNTSTIRGQGPDLPAAMRLAAEAGYDGIEPWIEELDRHVAAGGSLDDLARLAGDLGLRIENGIGFFEWIVDDDARRAAAFEEARRNMDMLARLGCPRVAAPPFGATDAAGLDLRAAAGRYAKLLEVGRRYGVTPVVEFWGASRCLGRLSEAVFVAVESGQPDACILADVFHMHRGGSPFGGLRLLGPTTLGLLHVNDYPAAGSAEALTDADRVFPGDGVAPWPEVLGALRAIGFRGPLSLELFNKAYWQRDALAVAREGLEKLRQLVAAVS